jgi:hypothetical protein
MQIVLRAVAVAIRRSIVPLMMLACGGCVTDQSPSSTASTASQARITISRSNDVAAFAPAANVDLNGSHVATLAQGRSYSSQLPPGPAVLSVSAWSTTIGGLGNRVPKGSATLHFEAEAGKSYSFIISPRGESVAVAGSNASEGGPFQIAAAP